jgi:hypothetical protein
VLAFALKDFALLGKRAWLLSGLALALIVYPANPVLGLALTLLPALYVSSWASAIDFKDKADSFLRSLPAPRSAIVGGRFLSVALAWLIGFLAAVLLWALRNAFGAYLPAAYLPGIAAVSAAFSLFSNGVYLAACYAFGFQNARWANFIVFFGIGAMGPILNVAAPGSREEGLAAIMAFVGGRGEAGTYALVLAAGLALYAACYLVSLIAFRRLR